MKKKNVRKFDECLLKGLTFTLSKVSNTQSPNSFHPYLNKYIFGQSKQTCLKWNETNNDDDCLRKHATLLTV